ncbi:hypothetical protein KJ660_00580 [Candidatus Micrarchaeota archaeon]|nr:hypothetical protein [Candidatus Micrarchaeota archaeon]
MNYVKVIIAAILFLIIAQIIHSVGAMVSMSYYMDPAYFAVWSKIMMPSESAPPMEFYYFSVGFGLIAALLYAGVYGVIKNGIPGKNWMNKGLSYGFILFLVATIPSSLSMILLINLPLMLIVLWTIEGLVISLLGGIVIAKMIQ